MASFTLSLQSSADHVQRWFGCVIRSTVVVECIDSDNRELRFDLGGSGHGKKRTLTQKIKGPAKEDRRGRKSDKQPSAKKQKTFNEKPKQKSSNSKPSKKKSKAPAKSNPGRQKKKR